MSNIKHYLYEGQKQYIDEETIANLITAVQNKTGISKELFLTEATSIINDLYLPKDILTKKNLSQWSKNEIEWGGTLSYSDDGINKVNTISGYTGASGYERYYLPITVSKNTTYAFVADFCSPTGFLFKDFDSAGDSGERTYVFASEPTGTWSPNSTLNGANRFGMLGKSKTILNETATEDYSRLVTIFNSGSNTTIYLTVSLGYIQDNTPVDLKFKNISLYQLV